MGCAAGGGGPACCAVGGVLLDVVRGYMHAQGMGYVLLMCRGWVTCCLCAGDELRAALKGMGYVLLMCRGWVTCCTQGTQLPERGHLADRHRQQAPADDADHTEPAPLGSGAYHAHQRRWGAVCRHGVCGGAMLQRAVCRHHVCGGGAYDGGWCVSRGGEVLEDSVQTWWYVGDEVCMGLGGASGMVCVWV